MLISAIPSKDNATEIIKKISFLDWSVEKYGQGNILRSISKAVTNLFYCDIRVGEVIEKIWFSYLCYFLCQGLSAIA